MREIKFRGQGIKSSEWYYGDLIIANDPDRSKHYYIITNEYSDSDSGIPNTIELDTCNSPEVDPNTIGQYTGLKDKNGKEIYEGDIVKIIDKNNKVISIKPLIAEITWSEEYLAYILITTNIKDAFENFGDYLNYDIEVIGNIYDNSELLEEVQNEQ